MTSQIAKSLLVVAVIFFAIILSSFADSKPPAGVGLVIVSDDHQHYKVEYVVPGLPAAQTDIKPGDEVLAVDDVPSEKIHNLDELVARIRGDKGTSVKLKVATAGQTREVSMTRGEIPEIRAQQLPPINFGREAVTYFYQREDIFPDDTTSSGPQTLKGNRVRDFLRTQVLNPQ